MAEDSKNVSPISQVFIRRGEKVVKGVSTRILIPKIKGSELWGTDEISSDGVKWVRLDQHRQLNAYFKSPMRSNDAKEGNDTAPTPVDPVAGTLQELAGMLRQLND